MSFTFQGHYLTYNDIYNYFNDMKISRDLNKKKQEEFKKLENNKYQELYKIIENHKNFFIELSNKKLCKYGGNSSLKSVFKFNPDLINDDESIEELSNLLSMVIKNKNTTKINDYNYLNNKINICIGLIIIGFIIKIRNFY